MTLRQLYSKLRKKYPKTLCRLDKNNNIYQVIDVESMDGETTFYIEQRKNRKFRVNAVWPSDEKGKRNLDGQRMLEAVKDIPGMC